MRLPEAAVCIVLLLAVAGCSRLTFIKPSAKSDYRPEPPSYNIRGNAESRRNDATRQQLAIASREFAAGNFDAAASAARDALKGEGTAADANTLLAVIEDRRGRSAQAGGYYKAATERAPDQGAYLNNYGTWLCRNGRATDALVYFDAAVRDPAYGDPSGALANAGVCAMTAGDTARVERDLRASLELDPENLVALDAMVRYLVGEHRYFDARAFSQRRLAAAPVTAAALQLAVQIETALGDTGAADRYQRRLQTEFPSAPNLQPRETSPP
ncbi:type IV pilus biogenesis/stability protein PilW [Luteimonas terrae]|uniref:Type IV pilus assembly protein PilF n=1 Tax=Luteimonas terrae TaxID=1530191 RepID=A0ABU1XUR4_9GAMM|nr:type IV pilus biogenesis/stability protein PilW [Luteimonas terrae]MDR7192507.1 type IV pilus assembly protein PilF [Luteimonas terrae]